MATSGNDAKFKEVVSLIQCGLDAVNDKDKDKVVSGLRKRFDRMNEDYKKSKDFSNFLGEILAKLLDMKNNSNFISGKEDVFTLINQIFKTFDLYPRTSTTPKNTGSSSGIRKENGPSTSVNKGSARQMRLKERTLERAEKYLRRIRNEIRVAEMEELTIDDLDNDHNAFHDLELLRKRYVQQSIKLSKFENIALPVTRRPARYRGSGFEEIDNAITKLIRLQGAKKRKRQQPSRWPFDVIAYPDVLETIRKTNESSKLGLSNERIAEMVKQVAGEVSTIRKEMTRNECRENLDNVAKTVKQDAEEECTVQKEMKGSEYLETLDTAANAATLPELGDKELAVKLAANDKVKADREREAEQQLDAPQSHTVGQGEETADLEPADECKESDESDEEENVSEGEEDTGKANEDGDKVDAATPDIMEVFTNGLHAEAQTISNGTDTVLLLKIKKGAEKRKLADMCAAAAERAPKENKIEIIDLSDDD